MGATKGSKRSSRVKLLEEMILKLQDENDELLNKLSFDQLNKVERARLKSLEIQDTVKAMNHIVPEDEWRSQLKRYIYYLARAKGAMETRNALIELAACALRAASTIPLTRIDDRGRELIQNGHRARG